jgi:CyaY protein
MEETEFEALAEAAWKDRAALDACGADIDYELQPGGVLELEFGDGSKIIVNRHAPPARSGWRRAQAASISAMRTAAGWAPATAPSCSRRWSAWLPSRRASASS